MKKLIKCTNCGENISVDIPNKETLVFKCPFCGTTLAASENENQQSQSCGQRPPIQQFNTPKGIASLSFAEAISLAISRITDTKGRSRRSEYWWWMLVVGIILLFIFSVPFVRLFALFAQLFLLYAITLRRLHDAFAPDWIGKTYLGFWLFYSIVKLIGVSFLISIAWIGSLIMSIIVLVYTLRDSIPEYHPIHGFSPKYNNVK